MFYTKRPTKQKLYTPRNWFCHRIKINMYNKRCDRLSAVCVVRLRCTTRNRLLECIYQPAMTKTITPVPPIWNIIIRCERARFSCTLCGRRHHRHRRLRLRRRRRRRRQLPACFFSLFCSPLALRILPVVFTLFRYAVLLKNLARGYSLQPEFDCYYLG